MGGLIRWGWIGAQLASDRLLRTGNGTGTGPLKHGSRFLYCLFVGVRVLQAWCLGAWVQMFAHARSCRTLQAFRSSGTAPLSSVLAHVCCLK